MPVGVQVASLVADGVSYVTTEKSLSDHGISVVAGRDCAVWRIVKGDPICRDTAPDPILVAKADNLPDSSTKTQNDTELESVSGVQFANVEVAANKAIDETPVAPITNAPGAVQMAPLPSFANKFSKKLKNIPSSPEIQPTIVMHSKTRETNATVALPRTSPEPKKSKNSQHRGTFYVIASFRNAANAERFAAEQLGLKPAILPGTAHGKRTFRVAVGPIAGNERTATRRKLQRAGFKDAWALRFSNPRLIKELAALN